MGKKKDRQHALLSASSASRWLVCPPSARLEEGIPDEQNQSAAEGTLAHSICELKLNYLITDMTKRTFNTRMNKLRKNHLYQEEMQGYTDEYIGYIENIMNNLPDKPYVAVEIKLDYSHYAPEGFGTGDCIVLYRDTIHVIDFKYGKGVPVNAEGNPQLALYALGVLQRYGLLFPLEKVVLHVIQPRLHNFSSWETTVEEIREWGEKYVSPRAELAFKGEGDFYSGEHCRFCKAVNCRHRAYEYVGLLEEYQEKLPPLLMDEEVGQILTRAEQLVSWYNKLKKYALNTMLSGKEIFGWKIVEGRSNRAFTDYDRVVSVMEAAGYKKEMLYQNTPLSLTELEKMLGKKDFQDICGSLVVKPPGAPTIAKESDKRPAYNPRTSAAEDFK